MGLYSLIILLAAFPALRSAHVEDLEQNYNYHATLDDQGKYILYWNFDLVREDITFAVRVQTTGWIGFGLSPNGQMPQSDVVIGWVDGQESYFNVSCLLHVHCVHVCVRVRACVRTLSVKLVYSFLRIPSFPSVHV